MRIACFLTIFFATVSFAQRPQLLTWETTDGHNAKGIIYSVNAATNKVTILVPKEVDLDRLTEASQEMAFEEVKKLAVPSKEPEPVEEKTETEKDPQFMLLGSIGDPTIEEWDAATSETKIATIGTILFGIMSAEKFKDEINAELRSPTNFNNACFEIYAGVELLRMKLESDGQQDRIKGSKLSDYFGAILSAKKWLRTNSRIVEGISFDGMTVIEVDSSYPKLAGKITNPTSKNLMMGNFNFSWERDGRIEAIKALVITDLKPGATKTFTVDLPNVPDGESPLEFDISPTGLLFDE
ncbi:hypothetical protein K227x_63930 [Rubripirellula lacrimiformis]|uniref:SLA1 homology domain-containing protein n=1 Tax=Rubripirellula lacrimiformis TaxID=1930273 RepID=A0A517NLL8_9BACT|nr:hypothetical protein [Rubripirellula lacrimiformis]QDT07963.1 hypothetical protein K227x_63930 [Rubripirellula lacrimiformis]